MTKKLANQNDQSAQLVTQTKLDLTEARKQIAALKQEKTVLEGKTTDLQVQLKQSPAKVSKSAASSPKKGDEAALLDELKKAELKAERESKKYLDLDTDHKKLQALFVALQKKEAEMSKELGALGKQLEDERKKSASPPPKSPKKGAAPSPADEAKLKEELKKADA